MAVPSFTDGRVVFQKMIGHDADGAVVYAGEGFLIRFWIAKTGDGRALVVAFNHPTHYPHLALLMGIAKAVAPDHVRFTMPIHPVEETLTPHGVVVTMVQVL